jgi:hypothetical protein
MLRNRRPLTLTSEALIGRSDHRTGVLLVDQHLDRRQAARGYQVAEMNVLATRWSARRFHVTSPDR